GTPASATADGFRVATDGAPALAQAGVVLYDGDRDSPAAQLTVNGVEATDTIGDSTVAGSAYGVTVNAVGPVAPNLGNALGYDSRVVDLPDGVPAPGATSAAASIATTGHPVTVGALVLVERVDPLLAMARTVTRADGSDAAGADVVTGAKLRYTLQLAAYTPLTGVTVTDPVPAGLAAVDGSLTLNGAPVDPATGSLAGGRAAVTLPALDPATPVTIGYDVTVTPAAAAGVPLVSRASVGYAAGGVALTGYSPQVSVLANRVDLALTATASAPAVGLAQQSQVTVALTNAGAVPATGVTVAVPVPPGLALLAAVPDQGSFDAPSGAWTVGALAPGAGTTLKITVGPGQAPAPSASPVPSGTSTTPVTFAATVVAEVSGADQPDVDSLPGDGLTGEDDQAAVTLQVTALAGQVPASPASPDALPGAAGRGGFRVDDMLTAAGLMLGSALILIGAMVFVSARRRRRYS
ncbi:MAG TPA: hypothetical protein VHA75_06995, partial [Rugosimonospora sp.]|nr:hypothetical protein [Rugosimonospora sp.]